MTAKIKQLAILLFLVCGTQTSTAFESKVYTTGTDNFNDFSYTSSAQTRQRQFTIKIIPTCFRAVQKPLYNPISATGTIGFEAQIAGINFNISFPAWVVKQLGSNPAGDSQVVDLSTPPHITSLSVGSAYATANLVLIRSGLQPAIAVIDALGNYPAASRTNAIGYLKFRYDQLGGTPCPAGVPNPAPWCAQQRNQERIAELEHENERLKQQIGLQAARLFLRPLAMLYSGLAMAGIPTIDSRWRQPDFDAPGWGNPAPYDPRYTAVDGDIGAMTKISYSADLKQLEVRAAFPSYLNECGSYF